MPSQRLAWKVGVFVLIGLVLLAALLIGFSKGLTFFQPTYDIYLRAATVGGLKVRASVLMSGVQVGTVNSIRLAPSGTNVSMVLRVYKDFEIHKDARFVIEQSGFLGDQYVAIIPTQNADGIFRNGDVAYAEAPFSMQEFTRSATGFITRIDDTIKRFNESLGEMRHYLLNPQTETNLAASAENLREFSQRAIVAADQINAWVATNSPALTVSSSNLAAFSEQLNRFGTGLNLMLQTNGPDIQLALKNLELTSENLKSLVEGVQAGHGMAGAVLKNDELAASMSRIANNLSIISSNLNRLGLWGILWQHKPRNPAAPPGERPPLTSPKESSQ